MYTMRAQVASSVMQCHFSPKFETIFSRRPTMASLDGRTLFVNPENPENDLKIISIDPELDRSGGVGFGASLAKTSRT